MTLKFMDSERHLFPWLYLKSRGKKKRKREREKNCMDSNRINTSRNFPVAAEILLENPAYKICLVVGLFSLSFIQQIFINDQHPVKSGARDREITRT